MLTNILLVIVVLLLAFIPRHMGMTEDTKQFIIKALVAGVVIVALYFVASPYRNCLRSYDNDDSRLVLERLCREDTNW